MGYISTHPSLFLEGVFYGATSQYEEATTHFKMQISFDHLPLFSFRKIRTNITGNGITIIQRVKIILLQRVKYFG